MNVVSTFQSLGIPLYALSIQNEPNYEWGTYPATLLSALNESVLANGPPPRTALQRLVHSPAGVGQRLVGRRLPTRSADRVGGDGNSVDGVAFHCYSTNPGRVCRATYTAATRAR